MTTYRNVSNRGRLPARAYPRPLAPWRRHRFYAWSAARPYYDYDDDFELDAPDRPPCRCGGQSEGPEYSTGPEGKFFKDDPALKGVLKPPLPLSLPTNPSASLETTKVLQSTKRIYDEIGGLLNLFAGQHGVDMAALLVIWEQEAHWRYPGGFYPGKDGKPKLVIRMEVAQLLSRAGKDYPDLSTWFTSNSPQDESYLNDSNQKVPIHTGRQESEYEALDRAIAKSNRERALQCISMGGSQIMGFNHDALGYRSAAEMYDAFSKDTQTQVYGMFDFLDKTRLNTPSGTLLGELHTGRDFTSAETWAILARHYNGKNYRSTHCPLDRSQDGYHYCLSFRYKLISQALTMPAPAPAHELWSDRWPGEAEGAPTGELAEFLREAPPLSAEAYPGEAEADERDDGEPDRGGCGVARPAIEALDRLLRDLDWAKRHTRPDSPQVVGYREQIRAHVRRMIDRLPDFIERGCCAQHLAELAAEINRLPWDGHPKVQEAHQALHRALVDAQDRARVHRACRHA